MPPVMFISVRAPIADMWGPVVTDPKDKFFCNCAIGSNNTGELCEMLNARLTAKRHGGEEAFAICYGPKYAKNSTTEYGSLAKTLASVSCAIDSSERNNSDVWEEFTSST